MQNANQSILTISLLAAFADGNKADAEREQIRRITESLSTESAEIDLAKLYQDVLLKKVSMESAAQALQANELRQLAYEMAVCVCESDGVMTSQEKEFLNRLRTALHLEESIAEAVAQPAHAIAAVEVIPAVPPDKLPSQAPTVDEGEINKSILNYSILNGALELLPQSWASMAIIPLQIRMVYSIGNAHGYQLDKGHITEFIAAAGVGMTSQYLEQFGRKLIGGLLGQIGGGLGRNVGRAATGVAFSFATTYALGQLAHRYYAGGRQMQTGVLRETFQSLLGPARNLQQQYLPQIEQKAGTLDAASIMAMVRNG
jgi:uncharacterized protein (DUF697 family)/tellurite resistance protein